MHSFERKSLAPDWRMFGLDSVQGYLELSEWYAKGGVILCCDPVDENRFGSMYYQLLQLEKDGLIRVDWESTTGHDENPLLKLKQIGLTTTGHKLLGELRAKSRLGKLKERLGTLAWAVIASVVTTLTVLAIKGA